MSHVISLGPAARMLTTREAALRLGVSLRTVQLWVEASILPAARTPGGHRRIPFNAVEALALSTGLGGESGVSILRMPVSVRGESESPPQDVLLVGHDPVWQEQCARAMEVFGAAMSLRFAETGYLALLQIGQKAPDLLVSHLELPGMDGFAMLRTLERCESIANLPVLALTHLSEDEIASRGGLPASVEVLALPVSAEALAVRVGRWLMARRPLKQGA